MAPAKRDLTDAVSGYAQGHLRRLAQARRDAGRWCDVARQEASEAARLLVQQFSARRVLLFGSVARRDGRMGSDIDLLVEGVAPGCWFDACAAVAEVVRCGEVDLVPMEHAHGHVLERARREGIVLHG